MVTAFNNDGQGADEAALAQQRKVDRRRYARKLRSIEKSRSFTLKRNEDTSRKTASANVDECSAKHVEEQWSWAMTNTAGGTCCVTKKNVNCCVWNDVHRDGIVRERGSACSCPKGICGNVCDKGTATGVGKLGGVGSVRKEGPSVTIDRGEDVRIEHRKLHHELADVNHPGSVNTRIRNSGGAGGCKLKASGKLSNGLDHGIRSEETNHKDVDELDKVARRRMKERDRQRTRRALRSPDRRLEDNLNGYVRSVGAGLRNVYRADGSDMMSVNEGDDVSDAVSDQDSVSSQGEPVEDLAAGEASLPHNVDTGCLHPLEAFA